MQARDECDTAIAAFASVPANRCAFDLAYAYLVRGGAHEQLGDSVAAVKDLTVADALIAKHEDTAAEPRWYDLRVVARHNRAKLSGASEETLQQFEAALAAADEAIEIRKRRLDDTADKEAVEQILGDLHSPIKARAEVLVDAGLVLIETGHRDVADQTLDAAEATLRAAPGFLSVYNGSVRETALKEDGTFANILFGRAVALSVGGELERAAAVSAEAFTAICRTAQTPRA
mmetsp:Transcript_51587/g.158972  ORF Transcript_51587/g.158972 Transcript_51587/m.158972 type:complete len:232 (+) Transcript_51587:380-1075(+)